MHPLVPIAVGAGASFKVAPRSVRLGAAIAGGVLGYYLWRRYPTVLSRIPSVAGLDPALFQSLIESGIAITTSTAQVVQAATEPARQRRAAAEAQAQAQAEARRQQALLASQAQAARAEAARLAAQRAASPLSNPAVQVAIVAVVALGGVFAFRSLSRPAPARSAA